MSGRSARMISAKRCKVRAWPHFPSVSGPDLEKPKSTIASSGLSESQCIVRPKTSQARAISAVRSVPRAVPASRPMSFCPPSPRVEQA